MSPREAVSWPLAVFSFKILFVAFIVAASAKNFGDGWAAAHALSHHAGLNPMLLIAFATVEIAAAVLFIFRPTEIVGGAGLLIVFAAAEILSLSIGEFTLRFIFYSGTVLFIGAAARRITPAPDAVALRR